MISQWEHHEPAIVSDTETGCHLTRTALFFFDDNFRRIAQWVLAFILSASSEETNIVYLKKTAIHT